MSNYALNGDRQSLGQVSSTGGRRDSASTKQSTSIGSMTGRIGGECGGLLAKATAEARLVGALGMINAPQRCLLVHRPGVEGFDRVERLTVVPAEFPALLLSLRFLLTKSLFLACDTRLRKQLRASRHRCKRAAVLDDKAMDVAAGRAAVRA